MKASQVIEKIQELINQYGDLPLYMDTEYDDSPMTSVDTADYDDRAPIGMDDEGETIYGEVIYLW